MIFQAEGLVEFPDGLQLMNPKMRILDVNYSMSLRDSVNQEGALPNTFTLFCYFYEIHHKHERRFHNPNQIVGLVETKDVIEFIQGHEFLNQFKLIE